MMNESKSILITGAARRIGRELALHFAAKGWHVLAHYNQSKDDAEKLEADIKTAHGKVTLLQARLSSADDADTFFSHMIEAVGKPDVIINNAALFEPERKGVSSESHAAHMATNVDAPIVLINNLFAAGGGTAINILDGFYEPLIVAFPSYAESKKLLEQWTMDKRADLAPTLALYGLKIGPTLRNERESEDHFTVMAAASPRGRVTPLPLICETAERMANGLEQEGIVDLA